MDRKHEWAPYYQQKSTINANMHVEAFHYVLKYIYLQGKMNRRLDKCVHTLLKITQDKSFEQLIKISKRKKKTRKHTEIQKRHKASLNMNTQNISDIKDKTLEYVHQKTDRNDIQ